MTVIELRQKKLLMTVQTWEELSANEEEKICVPFFFFIFERELFIQETNLAAKFCAVSSFHITWISVFKNCVYLVLRKTALENKVFLFPYEVNFSTPLS